MIVREWEIGVLQVFTDLQTGAGNAAAYILTFLGNELFYFLMIPLVYWCLSKAFGIRLVYVFLLSVYVNSLLKAMFAVQRPIGIEGVNSLYVSSAEVGSHYPYDSFPSGHAQGSATLWGMTAIWLKSRAFWIFAAVLVLMISMSRLYTGLHWPTDITTGMAVAATILLIYVKTEKWIVGWSIKRKWIAVIVLPLILMGIFPESEGMKYSGFLLGAGIGYLLEAKHIRMKIPSSWVKKAVALFVGLAGLFLLQEGGKIVLGTSLGADALRYGLIGLWGLLGAPYLFVKLRLYETSRNTNENEKAA
ncbi:phosphatase PAP2 family protein [Alteribacter keqinensis]|uniref:Phosphatase PAP2 family protein n=1 Tax=Alteribacter keqinensis TaxID=2483800 RepID=A0A3M7TX76_9BACI|nr:phosphatase PAP2 family protein [Alteribacter keqinensis]RNA70103.1 phosphatase PAP2 family protein [Alteribacter keqinensis]